MINKLLLCDCMDYMKTCEDKKFDLAIVDPPYGIGFGRAKNKSNKDIAKQKNYHKYDDKIMNKEYFDELFRISKNQIVWGANHFISKIPFDSSCWIVWDKKNGLSDFADCELAWTNFNTAVRKFSFRWQGMLQENMKNKEYRIHPNQKPVALYKWCLKNYASPGRKLFDSHSGSGSFRIAAYDLGFDLISCEKDKIYFESNNKRFKEYIKYESENISLFTDKEIFNLSFISGGNN